MNECRNLFVVVESAEKGGSLITAEMANGTVFVLSQAFVSGDPSVDAQAGTTSVTFSGVSGEFI